MGITDKMSQIANNVQQGVKSTSISFFALFLKVLTCFFVGLTMALIGQEIFKYGTLMFVFFMVLVWGLLFRLMLKWNVGAVLVFDLICVLVALLLRMYILIAP